MTLSELKAHLNQELTGEESTEFYTEAERLRALNIAFAQFISDIQLPEKEQTYSLSTDDASYIDLELPSDVFFIKRIYLLDEQNKYVDDYYELSWNWWTKQYFYEMKRGSEKTILRVKPAKGTLVVVYVPTPPTLANDSDTIFPNLGYLQPFLYLIAKYAAYLLIGKDPEYINLATQKLQEYQLGLMELKKVLRKNVRKMAWRYK